MLEEFWDLSLISIYGYERAQWSAAMDKLEKASQTGRLAKNDAALLYRHLKAMIKRQEFPRFIKGEGGYDLIDRPPEVMALHYVESARIGLINDRKPVTTILDIFRIERRTYDNWQSRFRNHPFILFSRSQPKRDGPRGGRMFVVEAGESGPEFREGPDATIFYRGLLKESALLYHQTLNPKRSPASELSDARD